MCFLYLWFISSEGVLEFVEIKLKDQNQEYKMRIKCELNVFAEVALNSLSLIYEKLL